MKNNKDRKVLIFDLDDTLFDSTNQPKETRDAWPIVPFEGWLPFLASNDYHRILVTKAKREDLARQNRKIDALGIRARFSAIHIVEEDEHKHDSFKRVVTDFVDGDITVIGNRIDSEIRYGNMLGLRTVLVRHGKYKDLVPRDKYDIPRHVVEIEALFRLKDIL